MDAIAVIYTTELSQKFGPAVVLSRNDGKVRS